MSVFSKRCIAFLLSAAFISEANASNQPHSRAMAEIRYIYRLLCPQGCGDVALEKNPSINNAHAHIQGSLTGGGRSTIAYNPQFMNYYSLKYDKTVGFAVLAHEMGHHIEFYSGRFKTENPWHNELFADWWAGCALAKAGYPLEPTLNAFKEFSPNAGETHPAWPKRHAYLIEGYKKCSGIRNADDSRYPYGR